MTVFLFQLYKPPMNEIFYIKCMNCLLKFEFTFLDLL